MTIEEKIKRCKKEKNLLEKELEETGSAKVKRRLACKKGFLNRLLLEREFNLRTNKEFLRYLGEID